LRVGAAVFFVIPLLFQQSSQSYRASLAIWDHSVTCHLIQVNAPCLTPARQAGTQLTYPGELEG